MNRNDVITALTGSLDCTRSLKSPIVHISIPMAETILELLKEQEPVKPNPVHNSARWFACGKCDCSITMEDKFCPRCGREVKWD